MSSQANRGKAWERQLEVWNNMYRRSGTAVIYRTPASVKIISRDAQGRITGWPESAGPPDYTGVIAQHDDHRRLLGVPVCFDAKSTQQTTRLPFDTIQPHQAADLHDWMLAGGVAFIALRVAQGDHRGDWVLPWHQVHPRYRRWRTNRCTLRKGQSVPRGTGSLPLAELPLIARRMTYSGWLQPVLELLPQHQPTPAQLGQGGQA